MNFSSSSTLRFVRSLALLVISASAALAGPSAPNTPSLPSPPALLNDPASGGLAQVMASAKGLANGQDLVGAEQVLSATNVTAPNTAAWHFETTQKLLQMASQLVRDGTPASVVSIANLGLQHLNQAGTMSTDSITQSRIKAAAADIYQRYLGDTPSAISALQAAAALNPSDRAITERLTFLQAADARLRAKIHPSKK